MKISDAGLELIKRCEGLKLDAYKDGAGIWTIGYGSTGDIKPGMKITESEARRLLLTRIRLLEGSIPECVRVPLNINEFSALISFVYNVGLSAFKSSTLLKLLNEDKRKPAADEFLKWNKIKGKVSKGLTLRRQAERALFLL
jgi:GH24 family phage-related lysozyme (muramidase)